MAGSAGRRNILRELSSPGTSGSASNIPSSSLAHTPTSPDETVIQQRGHKKKSATYKYDAPDPVFFKTPTKSPKKISLESFFSPAKTPVRSSPRKRLLLSPERIVFNEAGIAELTISGKRAKKASDKEELSPLERNLSALSHEQLVDLIRSTMREVPAAQETVKKLFPEPDLSVAKAKLLQLQRNVYKTFPRNIWGTQDDSYCYSRVRTHLEAFKHECIEVQSRLVVSRHWPSSLEYIMYAIKMTHGLPKWRNVVHNKLKKNVKKTLIHQFQYVLRHASFTQEFLCDVIKNLEAMQAEMGGDMEIEICINAISALLETTKESSN